METDAAAGAALAEFNEDRVDDLADAKGDQR
jgi:hypothetical protein